MIENVPDLLKRFAQGDAEAFAGLVDRYQKKVYYLAYQMLGNHLDADEVTQETFVRIYKRREELSDVTNFTSFLVRVATNYAIDLLRKQKGHSQLDDLTNLPGETQIAISSHVKTPDDLYRDKVLMQEIRRALETLPPRQRTTALLHDVEGYSKAEVAQILDCPEATVRSNLHIARKKLKALLKKRLSGKE
jgi:RNA polymerase sigma-70 factor (ECF subfamily)